MIFNIAISENKTISFLH